MQFLWFSGWIDFPKYRVGRENLYTFKIADILAVSTLQRRVIRRWNGNFMYFSEMFSKIVKNVPMKRFCAFFWQVAESAYANLKSNFKIQSQNYQKLFDYIWSIYHSDEKISKIRNSYIVRQGKTGSGIPGFRGKNLTFFFFFHLQTFLVKYFCSKVISSLYMMRVYKFSRPTRYVLYMNMCTLN